MNICVYGAASNRIDKKYIIATEALGKMLAENGHNLVYGGGGEGVMGAIARGFKAGGGKITGVIPEFFFGRDIERLYNESDETIRTETLHERKEIMETMADAFIIGPGGVGTYDEFFETLTLKQLGRHDKKIVLFNVDDFYKPLVDMMIHAEDEKFLKENVNKAYMVSGNSEEIVRYLTK